MKRRIVPLCIRAVGVLFCLALLTLHYSEPMRRVRALPGEIRVTSEAQQGVMQDLSLPRWIFPGAETETTPVSARTDERLNSVKGAAAEHAIMQYRLFGAIPVKSVTIVESEEVMLIPGGFAVGITIRTQGVLVVGVGTVDTEQGALSPGATAGLRPGDVILLVNGESVLNAEHLSRLTDASASTMQMTVERAGESLTLSLQPVRDVSDDILRIGLWVRDSTAGIGTTSFYDDTLRWFCALGHPVSDIDTQSLLAIREGRIVSTKIVDVRRGEQGSPGELIGVFSVKEKPAGTILVNSEYGIYGTIETSPVNPLYGEIPMGYAYEAHEGPAEMLATVSGEGIQAFDCEVVRVNQQAGAAVKGMIIDISDEKLMATTGGIVQGMSGCPVVQDGKLVGVVTHVFVNDPTRGYCVYAEWMYEQMHDAAVG